jgi:hypothetical protein
MRFIVLSAYQADKLKKATAAAENRLVARKIDAGDSAGKFALPERVMEDPAFVAFSDTLENYPIIDAEPADLWPPVEE